MRVVGGHSRNELKQGKLGVSMLCVSGYEDGMWAHAKSPPYSNGQRSVCDRLPRRVLAAVLTQPVTALRRVTALQPVTALRRVTALRPVAALRLVTVLAAGSMVAGCLASAPPCRCECPTCGAADTQVASPGTAAQVSSSTAAPVVHDGGGATPVDAGPGKPKELAPLQEKELLARYEGKPALQVMTGKATYYANSLSGHKTASGERYNPKAFTAAHRKLPFGTVVRVTRTDTNRYVYVRITDRGPFAGNDRIIDLSYVAAERLGMIRAGVVTVKIEVLN